MTTKYTAPFPLDRLLLILAPKPQRTAMKKRGGMVAMPHFWVCAMVHMDAVVELTTERDINCIKHLTNVTCQ